MFSNDPKRKSGVSTHCKACNYVYVKDWRLRNKDKVESIRKKYESRNPQRHIKTKFGVDPSTKEILLISQNYECAACRSTEHNNPKNKGDSGWCLDHNHETGSIRGVLCWRCNVTLGHSMESVERLMALANYLEKHTLTSGVGTTLDRAMRHVA